MCTFGDGAGAVILSRVMMIPDGPAISEHAVKMCSSYSTYFLAEDLSLRSEGKNRLSGWTAASIYFYQGSWVNRNVLEDRMTINDINI